MIKDNRYNTHEIGPQEKLNPTWYTNDMKQNLSFSEIKKKKIGD